MSEETKIEGGPGETGGSQGGVSRRGFLKIAGVAGALGGPLLVELARAEDLTNATLIGMADEIAGVELSDEEASGFSPTLNGLAGGIKSVEVDEEIEPVTIFYRRGEQ